MQLDTDALNQLRDALEEVRATRGREVPRGTFARLTSALPEGVGMTIDFDAAAQLGHPLVVLRPARGKPDPGLEKLTPREREVAGLVATGLRNKDIAVALGIRLATVKDHVHRILEKTGVDSRTAIAVLWNAQGSQANAVDP